MKHLEKDGIVTLQKLVALDKADIPRDSSHIPVVVVDVETTGFDATSDSLIQIALRPFLVCPDTGKVSVIKKPIVYKQEPPEPLPQRIKEVTGFTDEDLAGEKVNWAMIGKVLSMCKFVIAHNASFDRPWVDRYLKENDIPLNDDLIWACSLSQIDWDRYVVPSKSLEVLCAWHGFFYNSHSAEADIDATLHLLRVSSNMSEMLANAKTSDWHVFAMNTLRQENDRLKRRRYRWNPEFSCWWKAVSAKEQADEECVWLESNMSKVEPQCFEIDARHRFDSM